MKNAVIISLQKDNAELRDLALSIDYNVIKEFVQERNNPDVKYYIGSGKLEEVKEYIENPLISSGNIESEGRDKNENPSNEIELVIIDGELKPSQWFNLEKELDIEVYDRMRLILEIFADRARRKEAMLQVKLAKLRYDRPFVMELIHRAKAGEHPGYMAGGEYPVADYYEMIKRQMKEIKEELDNIRKQRKIRRKYRRKNFYLVSLAGYTNAGKSSLLNVLSNEKVKVGKELFTTLSTTTRKVDDQMPILLTDTVGFIEDLPHWLIQAFRSTLEEIEMADVVILLVDLSDEIDEIIQKMWTSLKELRRMETSKIIVALNKIDLIEKNEIEEKIGELKKINQIEYVPISIKEKENIDELLDRVRGALPKPVEMKITVPSNPSVQSFISWIHENAFVSNIDYDRMTKLSIACDPKIKGKIISRCEKIGGSIEIN